MKTVLEVSHLSKKFADLTALDDISFSIKEGEIVGLLGPNGAGKTTTIQMLTGLITPTAGSIYYFGKNFLANREYCLSKINFASSYSHFQARLTVYQNLEIYARLYQVADWKKRVSELADLLAIQSLLNQLYWKLSSGQKTRVILIKALINSPRLILMDEPTASLDPEIVRQVIDFIIRLQKRQALSILYTSHNMHEVARLCDRVIFLDHGKIVAEDTPLGLTKRIKLASLIITFDTDREKVSSYLRQKGYQYFYPRNHVVEIRAPGEKIAKILFGLSKRGVWLTDIDIEKPDLEDVFLEIAKGKIHELATD